MMNQAYYLFSFLLGLSFVVLFCKCYTLLSLVLLSEVVFLVFFVVGLAAFPLFDVSLYLIVFVFVCLETASGLCLLVFFCFTKTSTKPLFHKCPGY